MVQRAVDITLLDDGTYIITADMVDDMGVANSYSCSVNNLDVGLAGVRRFLTGEKEKPDNVSGLN